MTILGPQTVFMVDSMNLLLIFFGRGEVQEEKHKYTGMNTFTVLNNCN